MKILNIPLLNNSDRQPVQIDAINLDYIPSNCLGSYITYYVMHFSTQVQLQLSRARVALFLLGSGLLVWWSVVWLVCHTLYLSIVTSYRQVLYSFRKGADRS